MPAPVPALPPDWRYDGECTGFPNGVEQLGWDWHACCVAHDLGGSDTSLGLCIIDNAPGLPISAVLLALGVMYVCRPIYVFGQRRGWWR